MSVEIYIINLFPPQIAEEPPFIEVGADVSAKFKGAFCEATVKSTKQLVKCKVSVATVDGR